MRILRKGIPFLLAAVLGLAVMVDPARTAAAPSVSAASSVLMEQSSGRVIFAKNAHEKMRIASITKIMTAILAIESGKLDEKSKVSKRAVYTEGSSIYLQEGEKIKLEDLVYGLMLRSGNDAAVAIAEMVGGSVEGFAHLMNEKAAQIGMTNTVFSNPHGLDDHEEHYSTAYDMALLTKYAMQNETYRKISGTVRHTAPNPNEEWDRKWKNKNKLVTGMYEFSTGGKTGYTKRARRTLVSTATKGGSDMICVTLDAPDDWQDHMNLFNWGFKEYKIYRIAEKGGLEDIDNPFYKGHVLIKRDVTYPLTDEEKQKLRVSVSLRSDYDKSWEKSRQQIKAGKLTVFLEDGEILSVPVYYTAEEVKRTWWESFTKSLFSLNGAGYHG
ncbi:D-alanyl-D-alanine carboxypeptidase family protein [Bacillus marinisedimentorum]|uniref:D-alanyl-D-alanine carboxypeptidase family protein n=1 Tax=Bacillus marinisedimentorum TaxID=1821260 RepID=UPI000872FB4F|nr:D-alanyl-D-alanine carboxypeptidase family protein [Bacillus marinisedimentorum]